MTNKTKPQYKPVLTERQKIVVECIKMRLTNRQALDYLERHGFKITERTLLRDKRYVESKKLQRLFEIAKIGFEDQHIDRIDNTEIALKLMWNNYHATTDPYKRVLILEKIVAVQPYLSSFYEASKLLIENNPKVKEMWTAHLNIVKENAEKALQNLDKELERIAIENRGSNINETQNNTNKEVGQSSDGVQHIDKSDNEEHSSVSDNGEETTASGKGDDKDSAEARYRRAKEGFIF
jgi:hypothetical protein